MLDAITNFFEVCFINRDEEDESHTEHQLQLASAALMVELCKADQTVDEEETRTLMGILKDRFNLSKEELNELMLLATSAAREATSLYEFTSLMNEHFDYAEKVQLIKNLWDVAYADGRLDRYEEHMIRKVADLLYVSHVDFIKGKHGARPK